VLHIPVPLAVGCVFIATKQPEVRATGIRLPAGGFL
jgi:hypothetical protein